jgi:hypothetical protein
MFSTIQLTSSRKGQGTDTPTTHPFVSASFMRCELAETTGWQRKERERAMGKRNGKDAARRKPAVGPGADVARATNIAASMPCFPTGRTNSPRALQPASRKPSASRGSRVGVDMQSGQNLPPIPSRPRRNSHSRGAAGKATAGPLTRAAVAPSSTVSPPLAADHDQERRRANRSHRIILVALLCAQVMVAAGAIWALTSPQFQVRHVQIAGVSDPLVVGRIQALPLTGCNIFHCDTSALAQRVERVPAVAGATVSTVYPDSLLVQVTLRQPALLWQTSAAEVVIAADGIVLGTTASDPAYSHLALPTIQDASAAAFSGATPAAGTRMDPLLAKMAGQLRKDLPTVLSAGWSLDYEARDGLVAVGSSGARVLFGAPRDAAQAADDTPNVAALLTPPTAAQVERGVHQQLAELQALRALLASKGQYAMLIDLRWGTHPYYRLGG